MFQNLSHLHIVLFRRVMRWSWWGREMTKATDSNEGLCSENASPWNTSPIIPILYFQKHHHLRTKGQKATKKFWFQQTCVSFWVNRVKKYCSFLAMKQTQKPPTLFVFSNTATAPWKTAKFLLWGKGKSSICISSPYTHIISCGKMYFVLMQPNCFAAFKSNI